MRKIRSWWQSVCRWFRRPRRALRVRYTCEIPEKPHSAYVYIVGENGYTWYAVMRCPCGCGETLHMPLIDDSRPRWKLKIHDDETISLHPSIHRIVGCRSHFFIRQGRIDWCRDAT